MVKAKESRDLREKQTNKINKEKKLRAIANFPKTLGAILLKLARWIEVIEAFKITPIVIRSVSFEGARTQIMTKRLRGRPGQTNIWAPLVPIKNLSSDTKHILVD